MCPDFGEKWRKSSNLERSLFVVILCLVLLVLILLISFLSGKPESTLCTTPACIKASNHILDMVNFSANPCENFYDFACGNLRAISAKQESPLENLAKLAKYQMRSLIMGPEYSNMSKGMKLQRKFYQTCIDEEKIALDDNKSFLKLIDEIGGWPLLKGFSFDEAKFDWMSSMTKSAKIGLSADFFLVIDPSHVPKNGNTTVLSITPPLKRDLLSFPYSEIVIEIMKDVVTELGAASVGTAAEIRNVLNFIEEFNELVTKKWNNSHEYNSTTVNNLNQKYIYKPWIVFLNDFALGSARIYPDDPVEIKEEDYLRDLYYLLVRTPKRIQANYIAWYQLINNYQLLTKSIRTKMEILMNIKASYKKTDRKDECFSVTRKYMSAVLDGEYIRKFVDKKRIADIKDMIRNLKKQYLLAFKYNEWMDRETKDLLKLRAKNITDVIGWTDFVFDAEKYEQHLNWSDFEFTDDKNLVQIVADLVKRKHFELFGGLGEDVDDELDMVVPKVEINAYFLHPYNFIVLPAPIIQDFIFESDRPNYLNYGALGNILGHELAHAFALEKELDTNLELYYMTNKSKEIYYKKAECVVQEYDKYLEEFSGVFKSQNSSAMSAENIADISGQVISYRAYLDNTQKTGLEQFLPGIKLSPTQIFWVMSSTYLCFEKKFGEDMHKESGRYANRILRVVGSLRNSPYFGADFHCPLGSKMNPVKKCSIFT